MSNNRFNSGIKTVAVLMQIVFLIIVIVVISFLINIFGRSRLSFRDIGNGDSFFQSYFYVDEISKEMKGLIYYLQMQESQREQELNESENTKYKVYKLKFDGGESNLYYWFSHGSRFYTNMKDTQNKDTALKTAKKLGNYFYYDDVSISLKGNFLHMDQFANIDIARLFQVGQNGELIVGVDTALPRRDALAEAQDIYETYFPWIGMAIVAAVLSIMCFLLIMIYLTLAAGRSSEDEIVHLHRIDYLPTEALFAVTILFVSALIAFCARLSVEDWGISSSLILTGTLVFLSDAVLLTLYMSFVRKIKAEQFTSCSLTAFTVHAIKAFLSRQDIAKRAKIQYAVCFLAGFFLVWEVFAGRHVWAVTALLFLSVYLAGHALWQAVWRKEIIEGVHEIGHGNLNYHFEVRKFKGDYLHLAEEINGIGEGLSNAVEENVKNERLKTELVTNVSHDIKTPLTSIINYISLIKLEGTWNGNVENYVEILEKKSQRLKQLTEDLVEVSQITSGSIMLDMHPINMVELIYQTGGEFNEIFEEVGLTIITRLPKTPVMILADGSRLWRVIQNLYNNVAKYAMRDTRVFVELKVNDGYAEFSIKDISAQRIHKTAQDLSERFVRGDESRGTEGSGLGLSIARHLTDLMGGMFDIQVDGDLFTVSITFPQIIL